MCRNESTIHDKSVPELKKTMLKNKAPKIKKYSKNESQMGPQNEEISGEMPLVAPLVAQTVFVIKKWAPSAAEVLPSLEK